RALPTLQLTIISPTTTALALAPYTLPYTPDQYVRYIFDSPTISKSKKIDLPGPASATVPIRCDVDKRRTVAMGVPARPGRYGLLP
ncbi:uncharacterized protein H6S33_001386, partial [Morchella sextelata]|uniref:uncharacterized protein n=1 Tax=Morchella sextelata TaxID=1174677 RepID=UPI001D03ACB1